MHTIVIADDNVSFAEEMRNYFTDNTDFKVVGIAPDGVEAIKLVEKHKPDFLLLDIVMPELDGFGVLSALSAFDEKPKTIMVSGLATDGFVTKSLRLGASYFMAKPVNYDKLAEYMREMLAPAATVAAPREETHKVSSRVNRSLDERIANIFISVGIPAHIKGYQFLREAIKMAVDTPDIKNCIRRLPISSTRAAARSSARYVTQSKSPGIAAKSKISTAFSASRFTQQTISLRTGNLSRLSRTR